MFDQDYAAESTPLLSRESDGNKTGTSAYVSFRRSSIPIRSKDDHQPSGRPVLGDHRTSIRGSVAGPYFPSLEEKSISKSLNNDDSQLQPLDALAPLVAGGVIHSPISGYRTQVRGERTIKSLPAFAPFRRTARHRSFYLWWINEFRHWWKSSRLLVRLAGLFTLAFSAAFIEIMLQVEPYKTKERALAKNTHRALKVVKQLARGGPMSFFLGYVQPFTRGLRIFIGSWRWIESAACRRSEIGMEELMAFLGNRVSRMLARTSIDMLVVFLVMPVSGFLFRNHILPEDSWHPIALFVILGVMRSCAPYAASFQGSRIGRVLTRNFFLASKNRWRPVQHVKHLNLLGDDCCEKDEISQTADLAKLGRLVASALGKAQKIGLDGIEGQKDALSREGFRQIGAGAGGYSVYVCHRRVWSRSSKEEGEFMTILLHVTPYGPSILDVMPRYVVLEFEDSVDRRSRWSTFNSDPVWEGPSLVEGYCYNGAFFSPHHFAELKDMYDKQLSTYNDACRAMCKPRNGHLLTVPSDLSSLKAFLLEGKRPRTRKKNKREYVQLHSKVLQLSKKLQKLQSRRCGCYAPRGVILYFEGLDCSGKSSTGGLLEEALRDAGYDVSMRQYNKPPTREQKQSPWMDRFETPGGTIVVAVGTSGTQAEREDDRKILNGCADHHHAALVWDRGPAGDFVYNPEFRDMEQEERNKKYQEFMAFERDCFEKNILFVKLLFVTNRDSIAATLGKRLAQKKMARDLRTWLSSSRGDLSDQGTLEFKGLDAIEQHIDPTDFLAFNNYQTNLRIFTNFAWNTDSPENPWLVVNTGDRYAARKHLLRAFCIKLGNYQKRKRAQVDRSRTQSNDIERQPISPGLDEEAMLQQVLYQPCSIRFIVTLIGITMIVWYYYQNTTFGEFRATLFGDGD